MRLTDGELDVLRADQTDGMPDRCRLEAWEEPGEWDPDLGRPDPEGGWTTQAENVPCRIASITLRGERIIEFADGSQVVTPYVASLPYDQPVEEGWRMVVTVTQDGWLAGRPMRIVIPQGRSDVTVRRVRLTDVEEAT